MTTEEKITAYLYSIPENKRVEMMMLHQLISQHFPGKRLWYEDGKNEEGKVVSNPNIGYGQYTIRYAKGSSRKFFRVGLSANTTGISVYIMGLSDKTLLTSRFAEKIGKAKVTGYCIKFRTIKDIQLEVLLDALDLGMNTKHD